MTTNNLTDTEIKNALRSLSAQRKSDWMGWFTKLEAVAKSCGANRTNEYFDPSAEELIAGGYTPAEASAIMFVMTEDYMGLECDNCDTIDQWFHLNA